MSGASHIQAFAADVEREVCERVSRIRKAPHGTRKFDVEIEPEDLQSRIKTQPYALARHFSAWIIYNHPYSKGRHSTVSLGRRYGRSHSTICKGSLRRAESFIRLGRPHPYAQIMQDVCDALEPEYGPFNIRNYYGLAARAQAATDRDPAHV